MAVRSRQRTVSVQLANLFKPAKRYKIQDTHVMWLHVCLCVCGFVSTCCGPAAGTPHKRTKINMLISTFCVSNTQNKRNDKKQPATNIYTYIYITNKKNVYIYISFFFRICFVRAAKIGQIRCKRAKQTKRRPSSVYIFMRPTNTRTYILYLYTHIHVYTCLCFTYLSGYFLTL